MFKLSQVVRSNKQKYMQQSNMTVQPLKSVKVSVKTVLKHPVVIVMLIFCYTKPKRNQ